MITGLSFGEPLSLVLLAALVPLWLLWRLEQRRRAAADAAYGGSSALRLGRRALRRRIGVWFVALAVVLIVIAVARPQWGSQEAPVEQRGVDVAIVLDVSRSMTAADLPPSRAVAAATGIGDFLTHLRSDRVGLVIFSGGAFQRSPLTLDLEAVGQLVDQAQRDAELVGRGTDVGGAINEALALLDVPGAAESQLIILVSDGEDLGEQALAAAGVAAAAGVPIYTVAAGTDDGAPIPGDEAGLAVSRADRQALRAIASATGGEFRELSTIAGLAIDVQRLRQSEFSDDTGRQPIERFQWFLAPALILLVLPVLIGEAGGPRRLTPRRLARRRLGAAAILGTLVLGACGGSTLYQHVTDGNEAYDVARYDDALADYRDALLAAPAEPAVGYNVGNTLHQLRRYEEAAVASLDALEGLEDRELSGSLRYALGNHAVMRGALEEARDYYVDVLRLSPDDEDAKANLELVLGLLLPPPVELPPSDAPPPGDGPGDGGGAPAPDSGIDGEPAPDGGSGQPGGDSGTDPGEGPNPADDPQPGVGQPEDPPPGGDPATGQPDGSGGAAGSGGDAGGTLTVEEAQAALALALDEFGEDLTLEEAAQLLELIRQLSEIEPLDPIRGGGPGGGAGDR